MEIILKKVPIAFDHEKFVAAALHPDERITKRNQLINVHNVVGRRDSLTEIQQKLLTAVFSLLHVPEAGQTTRTVCSMQVNELLKMCDIQQEQYTSLVGELEKIARKGVWLYEQNSQRLTRTQWFQAIKYSDKEIAFQFTEAILQLIATMDPSVIEHQLVKGIQYRGKHTLTVFNIIWSSKAAGIKEYSIPELMNQLSLEHTRYSYGQLKLRVLEPSIQEIYDWDDAIFVHFRPTFSGRRVEGIWFDVITGEEAKKMRAKEPKFKFALPEEKTAKG